MKDDQISYLKLADDLYISQFTKRHNTLNILYKYDLYKLFVIVFSGKTDSFGELTEKEIIRAERNSGVVSNKVREIQVSECFLLANSILLRQVTSPFSFLIFLSLASKYHAILRSQQNVSEDLSGKYELRNIDLAFKISAILLAYYRSNCCYSCKMP